jgi:hypothetical protein
LTNPDIYDLNGYGLVLGGTSNEGTLVVKAGGNVGIGTTSPNVRLELRREDSGDLFELNRPASTVSALYGGVASNHPYLYSNNGIFTLGVNNPDGGTGGEVSYITMRNGSTRYTTFEAGNVGIGTTSPVAKFEVTDGSSSITLQEYSSGAAIFLDGVNGDFTGGDYFHILANSNSYLGLGGYGGGTTPLNISNDGKVGIGVTSPATRLYVKETGAANTAIFENSGQAYSFAAIKVAESQNNKAVLSFAVGDALASTDIFGEINGIVTNNGGALTGDLYFKTNQGDNMQERMRILANGNVGIGTTAPDTKLHVTGSNYENFTIQSTSSGYAPASVICEAGNSNSRGAGIFMHNTVNDRIWYAGTVYGGNTAAWNLCYDSDASALGAGRTSIAQNSYSLLTVTNDGNVGIGTTSPSTALTIRKAISSAEYGAQASMIEFKSYFAGYDTETVKSAIYSGVSDTGSLNTQGGYMSFHVNNNGTMGEKLRIDKSGNVGIGTPSPSATLDVVGSSKFRGTVNHSWFNYSTGEDTYIRGGKTTSKVHINDSHSADVLIAVGGGNVGIGTATPSEKLYVNGVASTSSYFKYKGHSLNMSYGQGGADSVLFDYTHYSDNAFLSTAADVENLNTTGSSEWVASSDHPFAGGKVLQTSGYRFFYSDYIPVTPGEELYGEIYTKYISGSGGVLYYGIERYDSEKKPIAGNTGTTYFVSSNFNATSTSWTKKSGYTTLPTTHTPYDGSNGGGCYYVRIRILFNYPSGGALRQFGGIMLKRTGVAHDQLISGNVGIGITNPLQKLHVSGNVDIDNGGILLQQGYGINTGISGYDIWMPTTTRVGIQTAGAERLSILNNGNVGIGTTSPSSLLHIADSGNDVKLTIDRTDARTYSIYTNSTSDLKIRDEDAGADRITIKSGGNVGIGTTSPSYKLDVAASGGIRAGGKTTYTKNFASGLTTSGEVVAEVTTGYNGASALFEFTCFGGNAGCYQKVIWSLYNASGTWYASNPINEGTNHYDVTYSSGEFTFKTRSGTQAYQPRVIVEAAGDSIDNSYA